MPSIVFSTLLKLISELKLANIVLNIDKSKLNDFECI